jgi:hypothetical protein
MPHGIDFYGSFLGIQDKYKMNITDDLEYLNGSPFFLSNVGKYFTITESLENAFMNHGSRSNKQKIAIIADDTIVLDVEELEPGCDSSTVRELGSETVGGSLDNEVVYEKNTTDSVSVSDNSSNDSKTNYSSDEEDDDAEEDEEEDEEEDDEENEDEDEDEEEDEDEDEEEDEDEDEEEDEEEDDEENEDEDEEEEEIQTYAYIHNFPVQMICMENVTEPSTNCLSKVK